MAESAMQRSAREENEESHRLAQARDMGRAIGGLTAFTTALLDLLARVEAIEKRLDTPTQDGGAS